MTKRKKTMVSVRLSVTSHELIKLINAMLPKGESGKNTQDDSFLQFMKDNHPTLYEQAEAIAKAQEEADDLRRKAERELKRNSR